MPRVRQQIRQIFGKLPLAVEIDYKLRWNNQPIGGFRMERLRTAIPEMKRDIAKSQYKDFGRKKVFIFSTLHYWVEHTATLGLTLAGLGYDVTLGFLPFANWHTRIDDFQIRQQNAYGNSVLNKAKPEIHIEELINYPRAETLPLEIIEIVEKTSFLDTQYDEQIEQVSKESPLYEFRVERNTDAARIAYQWLSDYQPDALIVPNGLILEFGIFFQVARHLEIPVTTYEFGEQKQRTWLAQNDPVMYQDTKTMWESTKDKEFDNSKNERIQELVSSRQGATLWNNFYRKWQDSPSEGEIAVKTKLGLDERPIVLMATNVLGDSLTLDRQTFSESLTEWVKRSLDYFVENDKIQFVLRTHPGEFGLTGPSVAKIAKEYLGGKVPENIRLIAPDAPVNTYDLIEAADVGMTYTTTVGLEMAMSGLPVISVGKTHYRGKGFTIDPETWEDYFSNLDLALKDPKALRLSKQQVKDAWHYAYRYFFNYPKVFPWHLMHFTEDLDNNPLERIFTKEGLEKYGETFKSLVSDPVDWTIEAI
ncbi:MAG: hypothetical protein HON98_08930 [Chloroflexi bacterium]|jgi:hypothetical protein|nr:hypothetical protein [Chloroflexota bacterium]MBT3670062.1 hypothetical protein [Chloroflexota bacterium]MBT4002213.1 hypothetical protein [Chloroflexota bacterium]MBT4306736.1 hypothetical protein [Chloroflexota bacterium]MBT4532948.1 hypothetical protein [Chloroflexota bacterium]